MLLHQFYLGCLAHASYIVADESTRVAVVVDPQRDIDSYLAFAAEHDLRIRHVFLTHFHADFVAGHLELRDRTGATIHLGQAAKAEYAFVPMRDGDRLELGDVVIEVRETPGHTPESISLLVYDRATDPAVPRAVLTGDTLFVGDVGRPDVIYPAHGAGSLCGKSLGKELFSTMGEQRKVNYALQPMSKEAFVEIVTADQPDAPPYFTYDAVLNSRERPTLDEALSRELAPMELDAVLDAQGSGAQLVDTRDPAEFAAAHLAGSINIGLGGQYASWAGTILHRDAPIVIVADPGAEAESALRLGRNGVDHVRGSSLAARARGGDRSPQPRARCAAARLTGGRRGCPHPGGTGGEVDRRIGPRAAHPAEGSSLRAAGGSAAGGVLRGGIPVVDRIEPAEAERPPRRDGDRRRHHRLGGGRSAARGCLEVARCAADGIISSVGLGASEHRQLALIEAANLHPPCRPPRQVGVDRLEPSALLFLVEEVRRHRRPRAGRLAPSREERLVLRAEMSDQLLQHRRRSGIAVAVRRGHERADEEREVR
jgi:glyoxylase-like metal-dependent hydrolase (beta-lactamase superfamily II)/rhodanese-related sulfurtransferase